MKQTREDLKPFDMASLEEIKKIRGEMYCGGDNRLFWDELESILKSANYSQSNEWERIGANPLANLTTKTLCIDLHICM